jgi:hypothetical protein
MIITASPAPPPFDEEELRHPLVADNKVQLPYEPHPVSDNRESLLMRQNDRIESLSISDPARHRPSTSKMSESK